MSNNSEKKNNIPSAWKGSLSELPEFIREAIVNHALIIAGKVNELSFEGRPAIEQQVAQDMTPLSSILYAAHIPYHLIPEDKKEKAAEIAAKDGPGELMHWVNDNFGTNDRVLVVGDIPVEQHLWHHLEKDLAGSPARYLVAGPGPKIEIVLRNYASRKNIPNVFLRTVDESGGKTWESEPGPALDALIDTLFKEHKPTRVIAFEPVRLPATLIAIDEARHAGMEITLVEAFNHRIDREDQKDA